MINFKLNSHTQTPALKLGAADIEFVKTRGSDGLIYYVVAGGDVVQSISGGNEGPHVYYYLPVFHFHPFSLSLSRCGSLR